MTHSSNDRPDRGRRLLLGSGGAALALGAAGPAHAARPTTPVYAVTRTRYTTAAATVVPTAGDTYVLPLATVVLTDKNVDSTLNANNTVTINTAGNYRVMLSVDWSPGKGHDAGLRSYGIRRRAAGMAVITAPPGGALIELPDTDEHLATQDMPGSAMAKTVRFPAPPNGSGESVVPFPWAPGTIAPGAAASIDVAMPIAGIVSAGDVALASLDSIKDATIGAAAVAALIVSARAIAADKVRVTIVNPSNSPSVTIPQGNLWVLAMSATQVSGGSGEARTVLSSATTTFKKGDTIYAAFSSMIAGDVVQNTAEVFLEVERISQTA